MGGNVGKEVGVDVNVGELDGVDVGWEEDGAFVMLAMMGDNVGIGDGLNVGDLEGEIVVIGESVSFVGSVGEIVGSSVVGLSVVGALEVGAAVVGINSSGLIIGDCVGGDPPQL